VHSWHWLPACHCSCTRSPEWQGSTPQVACASCQHVDSHNMMHNLLPCCYCVHLCAHLCTLCALSDSHIMTSCAVSHIAAATQTVSQTMSYDTILCFETVPAQLQCFSEHQSPCKQFTASFMTLRTAPLHSHKSVMHNIAMELVLSCSHTWVIKSGLNVILVLCWLA